MKDSITMTSGVYYTSNEIKQVGIKGAWRDREERCEE